MRILIDTDVLLDYIAKRQEFYQYASRIIGLCADDKIDGFVAAHSIVNAFYLLRKDYTHS